MKARFLTSKPRLEYYEDDLYLTVDNTLFQDTDGVIYLVPRNFITDLYSIPNCLSFLVGDSAGRDPRPALVHDFGCASHQLIKVNLTRQDLINYNYLTIHHSRERNNAFLICEDIPIELLTLVSVSKGDINDMLGRMMESLNVPKRNLIRAGVAFNFNWYWEVYPYNLETDCYKVVNHYKR